MKELNKIFLVSLLASFLFLKALAFVIPDYQNVGRDPEITGIESKNLIPGQKVKIYGKNFFELPRSANKVWINNYPARVLKSSNNFVEVIIPKAPLGSAKIKLHTSYLGHKSNETIYPKNKNESLVITFSGPVLKNTDSVSVIPKKILLILQNEKQK